jgi:hypothetical protein
MTDFEREWRDGAGLSIRAGFAQLIANRMRSSVRIFKLRSHGTDLPFC